MTEYIEREKVLSKAAPVEGCFSDMISAYDVILLPAADVAPVRHGRWEEMHYEGGILDGTNFDRCSVCGYERVFDDPAFKTGFRYCPSCGAKMDGERRESE